MNFKKTIVMVGIGVFLVGNAFAQDTLDTIVKTFAGAGTMNTRPFTVKDQWEIQWDMKNDDIFQLVLYMANGTIVNFVANQSGPGPGASYQPKGGQYYLDVNTTGNWVIKIVQITQPSADSSGSPPPEEDATPDTIKRLLEKEEMLNEKCRGSGDDPKLWEYCKDRDAIADELRKRGWCYGEEGQYGYQMTWHKCTQN